MRRLASRLQVVVVLALAIAVSTPLTAIALSHRQAPAPEAPEETRPIPKSYRELLGLPSTPTGPGVRPDQTYSYWSWPSSGYYTNTAQRLTIEPATTPGGPYFWAYQFHFAGVGADGGYLGLQNGSYPDGTKIALFAIWGANDAQGPNCERIYEDGRVWACRIDPYSWQTNREYRLKVQQDGSDAGGTWWKATVLDTETMVQRKIGRIRVPPTWGDVRGEISWTEYFGFPLLPTCADLPRSRVRFEYPVANDGSVLISGHRIDFQYWNCRSTIKERAGADRHIVPKSPE